MIGNKSHELKYGINVICIGRLVAMRVSSVNKISGLGHSQEGTWSYCLRFANDKYVGKVSLWFDMEQSIGIVTWCAYPCLHGLYPTSKQDLSH